MALKRNIARPNDGHDGIPFTTAEEAILWYIQCQIARNDGVRYTAGLGLVPRPCSPDDIAREVLRLHRRRVLRESHLRVLGRFGTRCDGSGEPMRRQDMELWQEALDRLVTPLRAKGIIE
jgi:hypothetical protein